MSVSKNILLCPLNWGLGHASRDIPVIRSLISEGHRVIIGGDRPAISVLMHEFPGLACLHIPGLKMRYSKILPAWFSILIRIPVMAFSIWREHTYLKKIVQAGSIDVVISDNRYGCWHKQTRNIIITHQLSPVLPAFFKVFSQPVGMILHVLVSRFDECWLPDAPGGNTLAGNLIHRYRLPGNVKYVGLLSRFCGMKLPEAGKHEYDLLAIISGPDPQRTRLMRKLRSELAGYSGRTAVVSGEPAKGDRELQEGHVTFYSHLDTKRLVTLIASSKHLVCRPGYTGIMDLLSLGRSAVLVPTPGQTEQKYLAAVLGRRGMFPVLQQKNFSLHAALSAGEMHDQRQSQNMQERFIPAGNNELLPEAVRALASQF